MSHSESKATFCVGFSVRKVEVARGDAALCRIREIQSAALRLWVKLQSSVNKGLTALEEISNAVGSGFAVSYVRTREITDAAVDSKSRTPTADTDTRSRLWNLGAGFRLAAGKRQYQAHRSLFAPTLLGLLTQAQGET
jgi:hypothetical protein